MRQEFLSGSHCFIQSKILTGSHIQQNVPQNVPHLLSPLRLSTGQLLKSYYA
ncbi:hypothetical protein METHB2_1060003 [Candidatus Methylobacter favarea]|uniref:Uncharacterized protein n=1 Tax=Candidatus Methylobacter favarea TaxID=2707345 RepID=A0A8S0WYA0_9GAMM|nr:hypothetical protein METHB2_1060003 [Candidatus Methylobacter favarea]